ncbi:MAG TPA: glycoside hydrolase family 65 protein [Anaerolineaceae bacterium]|jgi:kojibiose phosphorylase|nr:glycoside hydrolase family 65 protein [Anaerolineaceae bacterium]
MVELWTITESMLNPEQLSHMETVFTQGNGYLGTRGAFEERYPNEQRTTFVHGIFDDVPVVFTELVNFPDWTEVEILIKGERFNLSEGELLSYERHLDMHSGLLSRRVRWRSPEGRTSQLKFDRFASLDNIHLACLRVEITPEDYEGSIEFRTGLSSEVDNLCFKHWQRLQQGVDHDHIWLEVRTRKSQITAGMAARIMVEAEGKVETQTWDVEGHPTIAVKTHALAGKRISIEKTVAIFTDREGTDPLSRASATLTGLPSPAWDSLWKAHVRCWEEEWRRSDVIIEGDDEAQLAVRFSIYHLLIAAPRSDECVNIGAKTLSGHGYRGHSFWDTEIFMLPVFSYARPEIARNLLSYRYHNLAGAREKASENGFQGAQYPWESAGDGREVTPTWVPNQKDRTKVIRIWTGDIEIHISSDIAFAVWQYWQVSQDHVFLADRGVEIILETARFWASRLEWDQERKLYFLRDVIGPDEYHEHVDNNAYTNYFARWHLRKAIYLANWLRELDPQQAADLLQRLQITDETLKRWKTISDQIYCPIDKTTGLIEQFEGYFQHKDVDLAGMEPRKESVQSLMGIEGVNATQVLKQPDVMMLMYLLSDEFDQATIRQNFDYYTPRTDLTFGSSLGPSIQAIMAARLGEQDQAYENFMRAARADLGDVRGNAADGIHGASAGGIWQAVVFGFAGLQVNDEGWTVTPSLPPHWKRLAFKFDWRGEEVSIDIPGKKEG